jgi:5-oxopent-3-ene-1,2,5-tricarboxylate decarboxylase/2-hydroxyhepta-2,4-diene-1,7-dioate isomerase
VHRLPYKAPPRAPVLYIEPRNTWVGPGDAVVVPDGVEALEIGATVGLVIGRAACRVPEADALSFVAGYVIVCDVSVPHASYYRPSLRFNARDTFCPVGPFVPRAAIGSPDALGVAVSVDGAVVHRSSTAGLIRPVARLLADVSEFMTLAPGDVLTIGVAAEAPRARAGQRVSIAVDGLGRLDNPLVAEERAA